MATTRINALALVLAANLTDMAVFPVEDALSQTRKGTLAQLRTQLNSGAQAFTGAVTIAGTLNVTGASTLAALAAGPTTLNGGTTNLPLVLDSSAGFDSTTRIHVAGVLKALVGVSGSAGAVIVGAALGDLNIRTQGGAINFSTDSGTTKHLSVPAGVGGIQFPASQSPSADVNTLDDYEEGPIGSWTPTDASGAGLAFTVTGAWYLKVGKMVFVAATVTYPATANVAAAAIGGLPFASAGPISAGIGYGGESALRYLTPLSTTALALYNATPAAMANSTLSGDLVTFWACYLATA